MTQDVAEAKQDNILDRVKSMQRTQDTMVEQLNADRSDIDQLKIDDATQIAQNKIIIGRLERLEETVKDAVALGVKREMSPVKKFLGEIAESKKKVVMVKTDSWWTRFKERIQKKGSA